MSVLVPKRVTVRSWVAVQLPRPQRFDPRNFGMKFTSKSYY